MKISIAIVCCLVILHGYAQPAVSSESLYFSKGEENAQFVTTTAVIESPGGWHAEARYNYDDARTFSVFGGRTFSGENTFSWKLTPMLGLLAGQATSAAAGLTIEVEREKLFFWSQGQYYFSPGSHPRQSVYCWSEAGAYVLSWLYGGIAYQYTSPYNTGSLGEVGLFAGFDFGRISVPLYAFKPDRSRYYFVAGLAIEWYRSAPASSRAEPQKMTL